MILTALFSPPVFDEEYFLPFPRCFRLWLLTFWLLLILASCSSSQSPIKTNLQQPAPTQQIQVAGEYDAKGGLAWQNGDFAQAIYYWNEAARLYEQENNQGQYCRVLDKLSLAYQAVGQLQKARLSLETALNLSEAIDDAKQKALILGHLGNLHQALGNRDLARQNLLQGLQIAKEGGYEDIAAAIYNNMGNLFLSEDNYQEAATAYQTSMTLARQSQKSLLSATARANYATAIMHLGKYEKAESSLAQVLVVLSQTEDSHDKAYILINVGLSYADLQDHMPSRRDEFLVSASKIMAEAAVVAARISDYQASSYALGYAGKLYEDEHRYREALELSRQAVFAAQRVRAPEALYRWQWQTARLLKQLGKTDAAIAAYRRTVYTLQSIRQEMESCVGKSLSQYRKVAGVIYFELVDLLLKQADTSETVEQRTALLIETRDLVELLRVNELRNYFKDDCVDAARENIVKLDQLCRKTAIVYPVVLQDRIELLVSLPTGMKQYKLLVEKQELIREVRNFRHLLEKRTTWEFLPHAMTLYDYLIRPMEADLASQKVDTLVFVPGGALRTIPLAALHDGTRFLVDSYATAVTPGLNLTDPSPVDRENMQVMIAGLTQATQGFAPLPYVQDEIQSISQICPSTTMLDKDFVVAKFKESLQQKHFNILHIASHGQFQSDVDRTFILTFDSKLTLSTLDEYIGFLRFRQEPLDLLTLSACETAAGDDLAALGLAGVAIRAGARSALATLWHINDAATSVLIEEFYRQIQKPSVSRAVALQKAQKKLLHDSRYEHPAYWSPFLLINNWL